MRPDSWNFPLLLHVLGAMVLVGGLLTGAAALALARGEARLLRLGYWSLLAVALPGYVAMRIGAEWIFSKEERSSPLLHVLGAMVLVGGLLTGVAALAFARGEERLLRLGYWSLLAVALPGYIAMRIGGELLYSKEEKVIPELEDAAWVGIGYIVADAGALLLLVSLIIGGIGVRKLRSGVARACSRRPW